MSSPLQSFRQLTRRPPTASGSAGNGSTDRRAPYILIVVLLVSAFLFGGGSRSDILSLLILRPLSALLFAAALWSLLSAHIAEHRALFTIAGATVALVLLHLVPLPPALWMALPGREVIVDIQNAAGVAAPWRPLTLSVAEGWNAAFSLLVPLTALMLGSQLSRDQLARLLPVVLILGGISALIGLLQLLGGGRGALYFYKFTNPGSPVGLFANANHQAVLLAAMLPMLAVWASGSQKKTRGALTTMQRFRPWAALLAALFIVPLIIVVGSRAGIIAMAIALVATPLLLRHKLAAQGNARLRRQWQIAGVVCLAAGVAAVVLLLSGSTALQAFAATAPTQDRMMFWPTINDAAMHYFPFGSGVGSFVDMYKIHEPATMLTPNYLNHAHNDWLEIFATFGLPGIALLSVALYWIGRRGWRAVQATSQSGLIQRARLGAAMIALFALASIVDYPLRTPALMAVLVIAALWLSAGTQRADRTTARS